MVVASPEHGSLGLVSWSFLKDKITSISPELWNHWKQRQRWGWCAYADSRVCTHREDEPDFSLFFWPGIMPEVPLTLPLCPPHSSMGPPEPRWLSGWSALEIYRQSMICRVKTSSLWNQISPQDTLSLPRNSKWILKNERTICLHTLVWHPGSFYFSQALQTFYQWGVCEFPHCLVLNIRENDVHGRHFGAELKCLGILDCFRVITGSFSPSNLGSHNCQVEIIIAKIYKAFTMCWTTNIS